MKHSCTKKTQNASDHKSKLQAYSKNFIQTMKGMLINDVQQHFTQIDYFLIISKSIFLALYVQRNKLVIYHVLEI